MDLVGNPHWINDENPNRKSNPENPQLQWVILHILAFFYPVCKDNQGAYRSTYKQKKPRMGSQEGQGSCSSKRRLLAQFPDVSPFSESEHIAWGREWISRRKIGQHYGAHIQQWNPWSFLRDLWSFTWLILPQEKAEITHFTGCKLSLVSHGPLVD